MENLWPAGNRAHKWVGVVNNSSLSSPEVSLSRLKGLFLRAHRGSDGGVQF